MWCVALMPNFACHVASGMLLQVAAGPRTAAHRLGLSLSGTRLGLDEDVRSGVQNMQDDSSAKPNEQPESSEWEQVGQRPGFLLLYALCLSLGVNRVFCLHVLHQWLDEHSALPCTHCSVNRVVL